MSSHNPFRTPNITPQPTGFSSISPPASSSQQHPIQAPSSSNVNGYDDRLSPPPEELPPLPDEPPPAYSTTADSRHGEASVEFGPRRPFQPPPSTLLHPPSFSPSRTGLSSSQYHPPAGPPPRLSPQATGSSGYPGSIYHQNTGAGTSSGTSRVAPPPRHPSQRRHVSEAAVSASSQGYAAPVQDTHISDFARDFYAAGTGPASIGDDLETGGSQSSRMTQQSRYAPPPAQPPSSGSGKYAPPPGRPTTQSNANGAGGVPDDGRPTRTPVPGHPLLRDGKLLVYPAGYECHKCRNTGYKNFDPSHPCNKCWDKYSKPYSGAITYTPWNPSSAAEPSSSTNKTFQRPLPSFSPPHLNSSSSSSLRAPSSTGSPRPMTYPGSVSEPTGSYFHSPPPGAAVVNPGDPRIGGNLCWQCRGRGSISVLLFSDTCNTCGGLGRVFN
ncbi:hypothetical protein OE88DRAFT_1720161 [Heliocybe sulcata]|uniref:Uncharacterized protein n=1 Tax=Heliocybe sulcata TaxID=5364 RepID=A0A5C3MXA6_9AGAM|nr:hypothetical protein OE88DRAFT_1720161 [Heliocybe sulcata]